MRYLLLCLLFPLLTFAAPPAMQFTLDVQDPTDWPRGLVIRQATTPRIDFRLIEQGSAYTNLTGATAVFHYYKDRDDGTVQVSTSDVTPASGLLHLDFSAVNSNTNGAFKAELVVTLADGSLIQWGRGRIEIEKSVATGVTPASTDSTRTYANIDTFVGVEAYGPYRAGTNVTFSTNADGSVDINGGAGGGGSGDLTEVQVSGGLLTVATGTGPIPVVGLTAASVNSAETDPNAVLLTTAQTIAGSKTFNSPIIGSGANLTSLNASELDSGTIPLARIVDLTSNEVATATDTAYRNVAETDPLAGTEYVGTALVAKGQTGDSRGAGAVDLQLSRVLSTEVADGTFSALIGGSQNTASGNSSFVIGGQINTASGTGSSVLGGTQNTASGNSSFVIGGQANTASGLYSITVSGLSNEATGDYSLSAGRRAKATNTGARVFTDSQDLDFTSTASDQFLIRAAGGVGINTNAPSTALEVFGTATATAFSGDGSALTNIGFSGFDTDVSDTMQFVIGTYLDSPEVSVASDGATITLSIEQSGGGDLRVFFSDGVYTEDTTPAATVTLTAGSDTVPQINYVYLLQSNKTLTASTSGWPATEHAPVATVLAQSAASLQTDGAYKLHAWTDHIKSDYEGHLSHINFWIRSQPATWIDGVALTPTAGAGQLDIATTSGNVLQLHPHDFPAFDTDTLSSRLMTVNYPSDNYKEALDLTQTYIDVDANGVTLGDQATDFYNLVVWGVVSEGGANSHLMINLPDGSYNSDAGSKASDDTENTAVYDIPSDFTGVGFLIARLTIQESAGTYTIIRNTDLRGQTPATSAGGGATGGNEFADSVFRIQDTDDITREIAFDAGTITTGNTRTLTAPDASGTLVVSGSIGPTEISVGYSESNPFVITSSATPSILIENGPFQKLIQTNNITSITWGFGGTSNGGNISLELIDGDSYTQVWGVGNWVGGSNGTIENPWEQVIFHGTNSTALTGAELDADL